MLKVIDGDLTEHTWFELILSSCCCYLQGKSTPSFEEVWPKMRPTVLKVLKQEPVTQIEWQDLFYGVHLVCLWDEKGATKIYECLHEDIVAFINVSNRSDRIGPPKLAGRNIF